MALKLEEVRALAERVAASHGLDVVDVEYLGGGGKHRTLRVFLEKNAAERAKLRERVSRLLAERGELSPEDAAVDAGNAAGSDDDGEQAEWEADQAFLDGLPGVTNLQLLSGITHEDCEIFSRDFGTVLDVEELVPGTEYLLEVSSPGLDRRITRPEEFERFVGSLVKLQTFEPVAGNRHWQGRLASSGEGKLSLELQARQPKGRKGAAKSAETATGAVEIVLSNVEKAHLVPEF